MAFIYKLNFPNDERIYIGQTTKTPEIRLTQHLRKLASGIHHSKKLQKAYPLCGVPSVEVLEECPEDKLDYLEVYYVSKFNSYNNGFNATEGGISAGSGATHNAAKYSFDDYTCALTFLAYTEISFKEIAKEIDISYHVVTDIACQVNHTYLKELMPLEYSLMLQQKRQGRGNIKNSSNPPLMSPQGTIYNITNYNKFCTDNNLNAGHIHAVFNKTRKTHMGWRLATEEEIQDVNN